MHRLVGTCSILILCSTNCGSELEVVRLGSQYNCNKQLARSSKETPSYISIAFNLSDRLESSLSSSAAAHIRLIPNTNPDSLNYAFSCGLKPEINIHGGTFQLNLQLNFPQLGKVQFARQFRQGGVYKRPFHKGRLRDIFQGSDIIGRGKDSKQQ